MSVGMKKMGRGGTAADYLLDAHVSDYHKQDKTIGIKNDPNGILKVFGMAHGDVLKDSEMRNLCNGCHPKTGKPLLKIHGDKHRAGFDVAPTPPKSFSALWAVAPPEFREILEAINRKANDTAMKHLNDFGAYSRTGQGGKDHIKANFFSFQFQHGINRDQEPHLHIHNPIMNLTFVDGKWRTLETRHLMQWQTSANAIYMATLIHELNKIGIETEVIDHHFEIVGVPKDLVHHWSSRRNSMLAEAAKEGIDVDDLGGMDRLHMTTRKDKREMTDPHGVWSEQAEPFGFTAEKVKAFFKHIVINKEQKNESQSIRDNRIDGVESQSHHIRNGSQLKPSSRAAAALQSTIENVKSIANASANGLRILSRWNMVHASERDQVFLSPNASSKLSKESGSSNAVRWPDFSVTGSATEGIKRLTDDEVINIVRQSIHELHETDAVITENNLHRKLTEKTFGESPERINKVIDDVKSGDMKLAELGEVVNLGERVGDNVNKVSYFTTTYFQKIEHDLSVNAKMLDGDGKHVLDMKLLEDEFEKYPSLSEEQKDSSRHFFTVGSLKIGEGAAGVGKTFSMKPVAAAYANAGYRVFALAQADAQKDVLSNDLDLAAEFKKNIAQLKSEIDKGKLKLTEKDVIILDEGGLVGSKSMNDVLEIVKASGSKILITGEESQLSSVNAGPGFELIMRSVEKVVSIEHIIRQKLEWQREFVQDIRSGRAAAGLQKLNDHGELRLHRDRKSQINALIKDWDAARLSNANDSLLILAIKNSDNRELNLLARECLRKSGDLKGNDVIIECDINHQKGKTVALPFAVGDSIVTTKKDDKLCITNGTRCKITAIKSGVGEDIILDLMTEDGRQVTINSKEFVDRKSKAFAIKHGFAISKWSSQGRTVDQSFVMGGEDDLRYAYVGMSRFKSRLSLYISEAQIKQKIREKLEPGDKTAISKSEVIKALAARMSFKSEKLSTLDFNTKFKPAVLNREQQLSITDMVSEKLNGINLNSLKIRLLGRKKITVSY
jgi:conjugative relaxase-like TrwC/TraI family protein